MMEKAKTLIIIELKSGNEKRIESPEDVNTLMIAMCDGSLGQALAFRDIDGSFILINTTEFETIIFTPQETQDATS